MRSVVEFRVTRMVRADSNAVEYLTADGAWTDDMALSALFSVYRSPTGLERIKIDRMANEIAGDGNEAAGHSELAALRLTIRAKARDVKEQIRAHLGLKDTEDKDEQDKQDEAISAAWASFESVERTIYEDLADQLDAYSLMARWAVLAKDVPPMFRRLDQADIDDGTNLALRLAWWKASEDHERGKGMPSGS